MMTEIEKKQINNPNHIAIIMDGNRRWAEKHNLPSFEGHRRGAATAKNIIENAVELQIKYFTLFAFSSENWLRPKDEVTDLMKLIEFYLKKNKDLLKKKQIKFKVIGELSKLSPSIVEKIKFHEQQTKNSNGLNLIIALNYGSRVEITEACKLILNKVLKGDLQISDITEKDFANYLYTKDIPDPDLIIRTSNEQRLSNFLLWQAAYSEFYFTNKLWPDFNKEDFQLAIDDYKKG